MLPLISVIIPVYNVEPYLRECLDSVTGQTYRNLEIIIVDDGSTDKSGEICDEYARADSRIRVTHQQNGGVAAARNAGLAAALGEYIAWVDSDDVCAPDMLEYLYKGLIENDADMCQCGMSRNKKVFDSPSAALPDTRTKIISGSAEIFDNLIRNDIWHNLVFKLYPSRLFEGVTFPNVIIGEDSWAQFYILNKMERVVLMPEVKYYYRQRDGSITHIYKPEEFIPAKRIILEAIRTYGHILPSYAEANYIYVLTHQLAIGLTKNDRRDIPEKALLDEMFSEIRENKRNIMTCPLVGSLGRAETLALCTGKPWSWRLAVLCQKVFELRAERGNKAYDD